MTKQKNTKRALLASILSMMLCMAMLVGSTFAWFTDSVTSGKNRIVAGNLDVELEYSTDGASWKTVDANTNLFKTTEGENATLWEPGHTEYVYLRVRNAGTLALKYQFTVNVYGDENGGAEKQYTNVNEEKFRLSEHLVFTQKEGTASVANREDLWIKEAVAEQEAMGDLSGLRNSGVLASGAQNTMTLAVYMPTQVGNEANQLSSAREREGEPTIFLGITLKATQAAYESDSFGNDYDSRADGTPDYPEWSEIVADNVTAPKNPEGDTKLANDIISVSVPAAAADEDADNLTMTIKPTTTLDNIEISSDQASLAYDITVQGLSADNTQAIPVSLFVGKNLTGVKVYHYNEEVAGAAYDPTSGIVSFTTTSFSPFTILFDKAVTVTTEKELTSALLFNNAEITLGADVIASDTLVVPEGISVMIDLNGNSIVTPEDKFQVTVLNRGNLTVKNGEIVNMNTASKFGNPAVASVSGNLVLENCVISNKAGVSGSYCVQIEGGTATLTDCTINADRGGLAVQEDGQVTVDGGTITAAYYYPLYIYGNGNSTFNGTSFIKIPKLETQAGAGGNAVIYNGIDPEYGDTATADFTGCTFKSTRDGGSKFEIFNYFNGFTLNDCVFENVTDAPIVDDMVN